LRYRITLLNQEIDPSLMILNRELFIFEVGWSVEIYGTSSPAKISFQCRSYIPSALNRDALPFIAEDKYSWITRDSVPLNLFA
jgi:hypothetical protein